MKPALYRRELVHFLLIALGLVVIAGCGESTTSGVADMGPQPDAMVVAEYGDGRIGVMGPDDGNEDDTDACRNDCTLATCGDGSCNGKRRLR